MFSKLSIILFLFFPFVNTYSIEIIKDSLKTIAIYSSDSSFSDDYPVDSLVEHLNLLNENKNIIYVKKTGDDSMTGFAADYLVDIKIAFSKPAYLTPEIKTVRKSRPTMIAVQEPGGAVRYELSTYYYAEQEISERNPVAGNITTTIRVIRKNPYKKMPLQLIETSSENSYEVTMIINLIGQIAKTFKTVK